MMEIQKNALERIRIEKSNFKGNEVITVWVYYLDKAGVWKPTKKGLSFASKLLPALTKALQTLL